MIRKILSIIVLFLISACASYRPVQHIGGKQHGSGESLEACTQYIFSFPADRRNSTIQGALKSLDIDTSEVYSIEQNYWPYLPFIYGYHCVQFYMNSNFNKGDYLKKIADKEEAVKKSKVKVLSPEEIQKQKDELAEQREKEAQEKKELAEQEAIQKKKRDAEIAFNKKYNTCGLPFILTGDYDADKKNCDSMLKLERSRCVKDLYNSYNGKKCN